MPRPQSAIKLRVPHPRDWQRAQMPRSSPGEREGWWALLEFTDEYNCNYQNIYLLFPSCNPWSCLVLLKYLHQIVKLGILLKKCKRIVISLKPIWYQTHYNICRNCLITYFYLPSALSIKYCEAADATYRSGRLFWPVSCCLDLLL